MSYIVQYISECGYSIAMDQSIGQHGVVSDELQLGMEELTSIYVSMGLTSPQFMKTHKATQL